MVHTWRGHPIRVGEYWDDPVTNTRMMIVDGSPWGFPNQPWVRWIYIPDGSQINSWPILSVEQFNVSVPPGIECTRTDFWVAYEDACGIDGHVWVGCKEAIEYQMRNAPPAWEVPPPPSPAPMPTPLVSLAGPLALGSVLVLASVFWGLGGR
jgi:hypothetical protein